MRKVESGMDFAWVGHSNWEIFDQVYFICSLTPLAVSSELRQGVVCMHMQETLGRLVTVGLDRIIMIWDVKQLVR